MIPWICLHNFTCVVTQQISTLFPNFIWMLLGPNEMSWPNDLYLVIWVNLLSNSECRFEAMIPWICLHYIRCIVTQQIAVLFFHYHLNASWPEWNELTKWPLFGHLSKFVIKFRIQVCGNDSMDFFTLHHVCCDTADRHTFSHFHLNVNWPIWIEFTKWPLIRHLSEFFLQIRLKVLGSASMRYINITSHEVWRTQFSGEMSKISSLDRN